MKFVLDDGTEYPIVAIEKMDSENEIVEAPLDKRTPEEIKNNWKGMRLTGTTDVRMTIQLKQMDTAAASVLARILVAKRLKEITP